MRPIVKRPLHHRAAASGTVTFGFHVVRWIALAAVLFVLPQTRLEQLIVTVGAIVWHRFNGWVEANRYFLTKDQQGRTQALRAVLPAVEAVAAAQHIPDNVPDDDDDDGWRQRPTLKKLDESTEHQWLNFYPDYKSLDLRMRISAAAAVIEGLTIGASLVALLLRS